MMGVIGFSTFVIAGLDPAIHYSSKELFCRMDARAKPAHDDIQGANL